METIQSAKDMEEAIKAAVETARKVYATTGNEMGSAAEREDDFPRAAPRRDGGEMIRGELRADDRARWKSTDGSNPEIARATTRPKSSADQPQSRAHDSDYRAAMRQLSTEPDRLSDSLGQYLSGEAYASATASAARTIPAGNEDQNESYRALSAAIEQLRQDMNRNHSEAAHVATRKNHTRL